MTYVIWPSCCLLFVAALAGCSDDTSSRVVIEVPADQFCDGSEHNTKRLFLQQVGDRSAIIKWRLASAGGPDADQLCFGTSSVGLRKDSLRAAAVTGTGHREVRLTGLQPDTVYFYSIGGAISAPADQRFRTAPETGASPADGNVRIWVAGDSGTGDENAAAVREGFLAFEKSGTGEKADLFLMLGDNAYPEGTDAQYQEAVFEIYTDLLKRVALWPAIGNHDMGSLGNSVSADINSYTVLGEGEADPLPDSPAPYLNIFTLPAMAELGGVASGTEQYYSFDYGNVHVVSLDSQVAIRDAPSREAMRMWLINDLSASTADWTLVFFHHPPYSKGSHDTDSGSVPEDAPIFMIREQFVPVFDQYGVDVVYSGHSHVYERSYYLEGHTGLSGTFDPLLHAELTSGGVPASGQGEDSYSQVTRSGADSKVVYTVAGTAGRVSPTSPGFPHPAHYFSEAELGSVVIDAGAEKLVARFIDVDGAVRDSFTITR